MKALAAATVLAALSASAAMSQSMLLPAFVALFGIVASVFLVGAVGSALGRRDVDELAGYVLPDDTEDDDDGYVEYILRRETDSAYEVKTQPLVALTRRNGAPVDGARPAAGYARQPDPDDPVAGRR